MSCLQPGFQFFLLSVSVGRIEDNSSPVVLHGWLMSGVNTWCDVLQLVLFVNGQQQQFIKFWLMWRKFTVTSWTASPLWFVLAALMTQDDITLNVQSMTWLSVCMTSSSLLCWSVERQSEHESDWSLRTTTWEFFLDRNFGVLRHEGGLVDAQGWCNYNTTVPWYCWLKACLNLLTKTDSEKNTVPANWNKNKNVSLKRKKKRCTLQN